MKKISLTMIVPDDVIVFYDRYELGDLVDCITNKAKQRNFEKLALCHGKYIERISHYEEDHPALSDAQKELARQIVENETAEMTFNAYLEMIRIMYRDFVLQIWIRPSRFYIIDLLKVFNFRRNFSKIESLLIDDVFTVERKVCDARYHMIEIFLNSIN